MFLILHGEIRVEGEIDNEWDDGGRAKIEEEYNIRGSVYHL